MEPGNKYETQELMNIFPRICGRSTTSSMKERNTGKHQQKSKIKERTIRNMKKNQQESQENHRAQCTKNTQKK